MNDENGTLTNIILRSVCRDSRETRILLHAKWSNFQNTQQNCTKFSGMLGEHEKMIQEKFC